MKTDFILILLLTIALGVGFWLVLKVLDYPSDSKSFERLELCIK